jgi:hypothetical protein
MLDPAVWPDPAEPGGRHMLNWQPETRSRGYARANTLLRGDINHFLVESEQRVIAHCRAMLRRDDLEAAERQRLTNVLGDAEMRLQRLLMAAA